MGQILLYIPLNFILRGARFQTYTNYTYMYFDRIEVDDINKSALLENCLSELLTEAIYTSVQSVSVSLYRYWKISFLLHHARSFWFALAPCSPQNKFQDCYYHFQGSAVPTAILSRCPYSTVCANTIIAIFFFIVNMCSYKKNRNGKVQIIFICCLIYLEWTPRSSFIHFHSSCFQEETQAPSFFECLSR